MGGLRNLGNPYKFGNSCPEYFAFNNLKKGFTFPVIICLLGWCWVGRGGGSKRGPVAWANGSRILAGLSALPLPVKER